MPSILFVCTANQFRSPLAALCFCKVLAHNRPAGKWVVDSAGTWAKDGLPPQPFMLKTASRLGLQGFDHQHSQRVNLKLMDQSDLIIVMETGHKEALCSEFQGAQKRIFLLSEIADGSVYDVPDPATVRVDPDDIADQINRLVNKGFKRIIQAAEYFERARKANPDSS